MTRKRTDANRRSMYGGVIAFVVLSLPVLIAFIAFMVDLSMTQAALEQAGRCANLLAVAGVEQMNEIEGVGASAQAQFNDQMARVKDRVLSFAQKCLFLGESADTIAAVKLPWESGAAQIIMGPAQHYFVEPACVAAGTCAACAEYPCTIPVNSGTINPQFGVPRYNAWAVRFNMDQSDGFSLARIGKAWFGNVKVGVKQQSVAAALPRNIVFLVDASLSVVQETHPRRYTWEQAQSPANGRGGFYAFAVGSEVSPYPTPLPSGTCPDIPGSIPPGGPGWSYYPDKTEFCQWRYLTEYNGTTYSGSGQPRAVAGTAPNIHYGEDYDTIETTIEDPANYTDSGPNATGAIQNYRDFHPNPAVDGAQYSNTSQTYRIDAVTPDAQPLTSIFGGLNAAVSTIESRRTSGDKAGYIFFEKDLHWNRIVKLTNNFPYLKVLSDFSGGLGPINRTRVLRLGLFPGKEGLTNLLRATEEAFNQIMDTDLRQDGVPTADAIIYIGDFLPNCVVTGASTFDCQDTYNAFITAVSELNSFAMTNLVPNAITFNFLAVGNEVGPHTLDIADPNNPGMCLTEEQARSNGQFYVRGGDNSGQNYTSEAGWSAAFNNRSSATPFYQAIEEGYNIVRATGGIFAPVLQSGTPGADCQPTADADMSLCQEGGSGAAPHRRTVDRQCRSSGDQVASHLQKIVNDSPFRIVCSGKNCVDS